MKSLEGTFGMFDTRDSGRVKKEGLQSLGREEKAMKEAVIMEGNRPCRRWMSNFMETRCKPAEEVMEEVEQKGSLLVRVRRIEMQLSQIIDSTNSSKCGHEVRKECVSALEELLHVECVSTLEELLQVD
ncbi:hypothetical protein GOP47_0021095 [Adiantum capillus-veneris]|uniref:Uncharacterized protein n=1 Tax=Adiantum capillus-veneris TaxID=13818 RepID=A0A9D4UAY3_ADICA|nr:hypothetical protein GOP47_0021095 [Adiantum capillus-veneris]